MAVEDEQCNCTTNHQGRQYLSFRKNDLADVVVAHAPSQNKKNDGSADRVDPSFRLQVCGYGTLPSHHHVTVFVPFRFWYPLLPTP
jgi:hypothetical protein